MSDLTAFLLTRIAEDEAIAAAAADRRAYSWRNDYGELNDGQETAALSANVVDHIAQHDPARVLRECEAKRRMVKREMNSGTGITYRRMMVLQDLAAVYADHPDYRDEWRP